MYILCAISTKCNSFCTIFSSYNINMYVIKNNYLSLIIIYLPPIHMLTNTFNAIVKSNFSIFWLILRSYIMRYVIVINLAALFQSEYVFIIHIFKNHLRIVKKFLHLNLKFNRLDRYMLFYTHQMPSHIIFDTVLMDHKNAEKRLLDNCL